MQLNHGIASAWLGSAVEDRCHGWLRHRLLVLLLLVFFFLCGSWLLLSLFLVRLFAFALGWLDGRLLLYDGLGLVKMGQLLRIAIEIEQLRDSVRLSQ